MARQGMWSLQGRDQQVSEAQLYPEPEGRHARHPLFRPERLAWYAARVDRAKALIEARYAEPLSLSDIARDSAMSVFHFARIFSELEGQPPPLSDRCPLGTRRRQPSRWGRRHRYLLGGGLWFAQPLRHDVSPALWRQPSDIRRNGRL
jgi:AraC-like DNA-binding protein